VTFADGVDQDTATNLPPSLRLEARHLEAAVSAPFQLTLRYAARDAARVAPSTRVSAESIAQVSRPCRPDGRNENEAPESRGRPAGFSAPAILPGLPRKTSSAF
jgi:hypothetical protein